jgi:hypothetical protein
MRCHIHKFMYIFTYILYIHIYITYPYIKYAPIHIKLLSRRELVFFDPSRAIYVCVNITYQCVCVCVCVMPTP